VSDNQHATRSLRAGAPDARGDGPVEIAAPSRVSPPPCQPCAAGSPVVCGECGEPYHYDEQPCEHERRPVHRIDMGPNAYPDDGDVPCGRVA
jgi:hypothetical protein